MLWFFSRYRVDSGVKSSPSSSTQNEFVWSVLIVLLTSLLRGTTTPFPVRQEIRYWFRPRSSCSQSCSQSRPLCRQRTFYLSKLKNEYPSYHFFVKHLAFVSRRPPIQLWFQSWVCGGFLTIWEFKLGEYRIALEAKGGSICWSENFSLFKNLRVTSLIFQDMRVWQTKHGALPRMLGYSSVWWSNTTISSQSIFERIQKRSIPVQ